MAESDLLFIDVYNKICQIIRTKPCVDVDKKM